MRINVTHKLRLVFFSRSRSISKHYVCVLEHLRIDNDKVNNVNFSKRLPEMTVDCK